MSEVKSALPSLVEILLPISSPLAVIEQQIENIIHSRESLMTRIVGHVRGFQGKRLRPALVFFGALSVSDSIAQDDQEDIITLAAIAELIHTVTLIHDDIIDRADVRRNAKTFNRLWDNQIAVIFGDYLFSKAFTMTLSLSEPHVRERIAEVVSDLCEGEIKQLEGRNNVMMDEETYYDMILLKTATFLGCCSGMGAKLAGADEKTHERLERIGNRLGCAFQIVDDCLDIMGTEGEMGKSLGTDIATGKFTLPLIKLLAHLSASQFREIKNLFSAGEGYLAKERIFLWVQETGALEEAWQEASRFTNEAWKDISLLPESKGRQGLEQLADYLIQRNH